MTRQNPTPISAPAHPVPQPVRHRRGRRRSQAERQLVSALVQRLRAGADVRQRKARRTRAAIKVRAYENELKLDIAIERLIDDLQVM
jgi:hypothetical protein